MNKRIFSTLCTLALAGQSFSQIDINLPDGAGADPQVVLKNHSPATMLINGWRFEMDRKIENFRLEEIQGPLEQTPLASGGVQVESRPSQMFYKLLGMNQELLAWYKLPWGAEPVTLSNPKLLLKKRPDKLTLQDEPQIALADIDAITAGADYYSAPYRSVDTLAIRGGVYAGGLFDTWYGETQIQMAVPTNEFVISNTPLKIDPSNTDGPLYWMALAMGQEYRHIDFQWLTAIGAKETFAGTNSIYRGDNKERAFGPFEVESSTGSGKALAYYQFFPDYRDSLAAYAHLAGAMTSIGFDYDGVEFMAHYLDADFTPIGSAMTVNGVLFSVLTWYFTYDLLVYAEDVCWFELLEEAKDPYIGLAAMSPIYNLGINGGGRDIGNLILPNNYKVIANDPKGRDHFPSGNSSYRQSVQIVVDQLVNASKQAQSDTSVEIMDMPISKEQVQAFFFGDGGTAQSLGKGGLCHHFVLDRQQLWDTVSAAFDKLKGRAPSTEGTDAISYRYDFLTLLRTVKEPFAQKRMAMHGNEGNNWIRDYSKGSVQADGTPKDTLFPAALLTAPATQYPLVVDASDDIAIASVEWTTDSMWQQWHKAEGSTGGTEAQFTISPTAATIGVDPASTYALWIRVTDSYGNSEIQKVLTDAPVSTVQAAHSSSAVAQLKCANGQLTMDGLGETALSLFTLSGKAIGTYTLPRGAALSLDALNLSAGVYLVQYTDGVASGSGSFMIQ